MWSRKRRKEAKGSGGGAQGKEGSARSSSLPPTQPPSPRGSRSNKPTPTARPQANTSLPPSPPLPPPPPPVSTPPAAIRAEPGPPLANPNLKPGITIPLPAAPINPAAILDSLKSSLQHEAVPPPLIPPTNHPPSTHSLSTAAALATVGMGSAPIMATNNTAVAMGSVPVTIGTGSSSVAVVQQKTDQLQKVIEAQRTQLDLLSQITKTLADQHHRHPHSMNVRKPGVTGGNRPHPLPTSLPTQGPVTNRLQTFDYGNRSSTELQSLAIQHLEHEYSVRGSWP